jgi:hypothetical protein
MGITWTIKQVDRHRSRNLFIRRETKSVPRTLPRDFLKSKSILYIALPYGMLYTMCIYMNLTYMLFYCI